MNITGAFFLASLLFSAWYVLARLRINFTLSSVGLLLLLAFHGPAYWIYTRYWIHGRTFMNKLYDSSTTAIAPPGLGKVPGYDHLARLADDPAFDAALANLDIAMGFVFFGSVLGVFLADRALRGDHRQMSIALASWQASGLNSCLKHRWLKTTFWTLLTACSIALVFLYLQTGKLELVYNYFFTAGSEIEKIRWRREDGGFSYFWNLFFATIAVFTTVYAINEVRFSKVTALLITAIFIALVILGKMAYLSKAPVLVYVLQIGLALIISRSLRVSRNAMVSLTAILVGGALVMVFVANSSMTGISSGLIFLFYRLFMIPNESLVEYFLAFPSYLSHTNGLDNRFIAFFLGEPKLLESYWRVAETLRGVGGSTTTAMFIGDAWAEFAWAGVVFFPILFGALLRCLDTLLIVRLGKTSASVAGLSLGYYGIFIALSTSLFTALLTGGLLMIPFLVLISGFAQPWRPAGKVG